MIKNFKGKTPKTENAVFVADNAVIIGDVELAEDTSVWYGAVLRGDLDSIKIGKGSNVQDNCTFHCAKGYPIVIGENVTIGHNAVVHGCEVGDGSLIGMNATVLNGAKIGKNCLVGAGAVVGENKEFPDNSLIVGVPAKVVREMTPEGIQSMLENSQRYVEEAKEYAE